MSSYVDEHGNIKVDEISSGFERVPLGVYNAVLAAVAMQEPKAPGKGETLVVTWRILEGPHAGESLYVYYDFTVYEQEGKKPLIRGVGDLLKDFAAAGVPFDPKKEVLSQSCTKNAKLFTTKLKNVPVRLNISERAGKDKVTGQQKLYRNTRILEALPKKSPAASTPVAAAVVSESTGSEDSADYLD